MCGVWFETVPYAALHRFVRLSMFVSSWVQKSHVTWYSCVMLIISGWMSWSGNIRYNPICGMKLFFKYSRWGRYREYRVGFVWWFIIKRSIKECIWNLVSFAKSRTYAKTAQLFLCLSFCLYAASPFSSISSCHMETSPQLKIRISNLVFFHWSKTRISKQTLAKIFTTISMIFYNNSIFS